VEGVQSITLGTNIHYVNGHCGNGRQGYMASKVKLTEKRSPA